MRPAMNEPRADRGTDDDVVDPAVAVAKLRWRLATYRRTALRGVAECIVRVDALRLRLNDPALDAFLDGFRSIEAELRAMNPDGPIEPTELAALVDRLTALQAAVAAFGTAPRARETA